MSSPFSVAVFGASGLTGIQLLSLLEQHPNVNEILAVSRNHAGKSIAAFYPALKGASNVKFCSPDDTRLESVGCVFSALPHGSSFPFLQTFDSREIPIIDLSSDFRLSTAEEFAEVCGEKHPNPSLLEKFEHVVPEINMPAPGDKPKRISVAGCTSTAVLLALWPLLSAGLLNPRRVIVDVKTSSSASFGRKAESQMHFIRSDAVRPYKVLQEHRHCGEVRSFVKKVCSIDLGLQLHCFAVDMSRGLSAAIYVELERTSTVAELSGLFREAYFQRRCIRLFRHPNSNERLPNPKNSRFTNLCDIGFELSSNGKDLVLISCVDNLLKGGAGQAVQIFNLLSGLDETVGLPLRSPIP